MRAVGVPARFVAGNLLGLDAAAIVDPQLGIVCDREVMAFRRIVVMPRNAAGGLGLGQGVARGGGILRDQPPGIRFGGGPMSSRSPAVGMAW